MKLIALRGAITCEANTVDAITESTQELLTEVLKRNNIEHDNVVSVLFTATPDLNAEFPATAARAIGFGDVPLLCAQEIAVPHGMPRCVRVMVHCYADHDDLHHVYLRDARGLRDDLPE